MLGTLWQRLAFWKDCAVSALFILLDSVWLAIFSIKHRFTRRPLRSPVAVVSCAQSIEAVLLWLPAAQRLIPTLRNKGYRVAILVPPDSIPLLDSLKENAELIGFDALAWRKKIGYRWKQAAAIHDLRADLALETSASRRVSGEDSLIRFTAAGRRIAWEGDAHHSTRFGHRFGLRFYNKVLPNPPNRPLPLHATEAHERMVAILGESLAPLSEPVFPASFLVPPRDMELPERYVVLAPGAFSDLHRWPEASFAAVVDTIHQHYGLPVLLCGSQSDAPHAAVIMALSKAVLADLSGKIALHDLPAVVARASLVIGHDGLFVHLASLVGTPSLSLTGGGDWGHRLPYSRSRLRPDRLAPIVLSHPMPCYGCRWRCVHSVPAGEPAPCLSSLPPAQVIAALADLLPRPPDKKKGQ